MSTATTCLTPVIATRSPWHQRLWHPLEAALAGAWAQWRRQSRHADCLAALRALPRHTLRDIGMAECVPDEGTWLRSDGEFGRWR